MKKQKIFLVSGLLLSVTLLAGCGSKPEREEIQPAADSGISATQDDLQAALPETVAKEPGVNVDQEVNNITKDLNAASADDLNSAGLSDTNLGL